MIHQTPCRALATIALTIGLTVSVIGAPASAADMAAIESAPVSGKGTLSGASNHVTKGSVKIVTVGGKNLLVLGKDFWFDGAPDPKWGFGQGGTFIPCTLISPLASNNGEQVYEIPAHIDLAKFNTVVLWCERFSVPLGQAALN